MTCGRLQGRGRGRQMKLEFPKIGMRMVKTAVAVVVCFFPVSALLGAHSRGGI